MIEWKASQELLHATFERRDISSADKAVFMGLFRHLNLKTGQCNPGRDRLIESAGSSRATVLRALATLRSKGLIDYVSEAGGSPKNTNKYTFPALIDRAHPEPGQCRKMDRAQDETGIILSSKGAQDETLPGSGRAPNKEENFKKNIHTGSDDVRPGTMGTDAFEDFWSAYPKDPSMKKDPAFKAWQNLTDADRLDAMAHLPSLQSFYADRPTARREHAKNYISGGTWRGHVSQQTMSTGKGGQVRIYEETPEAERWRQHHEARNEPFKLVLRDEQLGKKYAVRDSRFPPTPDTARKEAFAEGALEVEACAGSRHETAAPARVGYDNVDRSIRSTREMRGSK